MLFGGNFPYGRRMAGTGDFPAVWTLNVIIIHNVLIKECNLAIGHAVNCRILIECSIGLVDCENSGRQGLTPVQCRSNCPDA